MAFLIGFRKSLAQLLLPTEPPALPAPAPTGTEPMLGDDPVPELLANLASERSARLGAEDLLAAAEARADAHELRLHELAATRSAVATQPVTVSAPVPKPPKPSQNASTKARGKRIGELEQRLEDAVTAVARHRGRAEDAERHAAELEAKLAKLSEHQAAAPRGSLAETWWSPGDDCLEAILRELERACESVDVCVFTITDGRLSQALVAAYRRRVRVRIVTDNDKSHDEGSDVKRLQELGLEVRVDQTEFHMHHKFAVFDGRRALTGSYNWTRGAARNNEEHIIVTDDPRIVDALSQGFVRLWKKFST